MGYHKESSGTTDKDDRDLNSPSTMYRSMCGSEIDIVQRTLLVRIMPRRIDQIVLYTETELDPIVHGLR